MVLSFVLFLLAGLSAAAEKGPDEVLAVLNGQPISRSEIEKDIAFKLYRLRGSMFMLMKRQTEEIVDQRLLAAEAARQKLSVKQLLLREVDAKVRPPDAKTIDAYLGAHPSKGVGQSQRRIRAQTYLHQRALIQRRLDLIARLRQQADVKFLLTQPQRPRIRLDIEEEPWRGSPAAAVTLVHYADFTSRMCALSADKIKRAMADFPHQIKWVHRNYLNRPDERALAAVAAADRARQAGKFWQFHDAVFALKGQLFMADIARISKNLELAPGGASALAPDSRQLIKLKQDMAAAKKAGVAAAPVIFVNGLYFSGTFAYRQLKALIEQELSAIAKK